LITNHSEILLLGAGCCKNINLAERNMNNSVDKRNPAEHRLVYINGEMVPEPNACVSVRDKGFVYGDSVFDTARTFAGKLFRLDAHIERLYRSLALTQIDCGLTPQEMTLATEQLVEANLPLLPDGEDFWVTQRVTTGLQPFDGEPLARSGPTVIIDCIPIPLRARAASFRDGIDAAISNRKRISPDALSANIKSNNYLNLFLAQREVQEQYPGAWALMCDSNGNIAEGAGCNYFAVKDGCVYTPTDEYVLPGVSRQIVIEICQSSGIEIQVAEMSMEQALNADEAFFSSTSLCVCPVRSINAKTYPGGIPGPYTGQIMQAFIDLVGFDYVAQYLRFIGNSSGSTGL
jgi:branched-chain amino acid aminotransferase